MEVGAVINLNCAPDSPFLFIIAKEVVQIPRRGGICTKLPQWGGFVTYSTFSHICTPVGAFELALTVAPILHFLGLVSS